MFLNPSLVMMVIATTRMYRSLQYFAPPFSSYDILPINYSPRSRCLCHLSAPDSNDDQRTRNSRLVSKTKDSSTIRIPSNRLEVAVHKTYEEYPMSQMNRCGPYPDKPRELDIDDKVKDCEGDCHL